MSLNDVVGEIAAGSAVALASGAVTGGAAWVGLKVRELVRRGSTAEQDAVIAVFDDRDATSDELVGRLTPLIRVHLDAHPEAIPEFKALTMAGTTLYNQQNTGSGLFIGGDNHGGLTINHGGLARD
ncbi:hypothetical protein [Streptomyces sp. NBC_01264]|uniref:hypothetical protein n=1 Tax=Streptomyces sp. NBC_01264 TaxID=2903804 RepID=UPI002258140C|nr:hypothetical protein [Streptomyces sp. NBC_01264]MCX4783071.1 hypothetical protein [Streptomyces sp. NBC_01264]